jgi:hypothetical protein
VKALKLTWDTGPTQCVNQDRLEAEYSNTNLFSPDTWVVWKDGEVTRGLYGSLLDLLPEMEPGEVWTCDNVSIQLTCTDVPLYSTEVQKCVGTNEIYSLFDEGLITLAEAELALGLEGEESHG